MGSRLLSAFALAAWSGEAKTRIRLKQWSITLAIYLASAGVMAFLSRWQVLPLRAVLGWLAFVLTGLGVFYGLMRSGWSRRFRDPALTEWQIVFGVLCVLWGYSMSGVARSGTLFAMMVVLTFGAFSVGWRRMAALTLFALLALGGTMLLMHSRAPAHLDPLVDLANFLLAAVMLPASSAVAAILSHLRSRLRQQRAELASALEKIQHLATHDELTGLANRRRAQQQLAAEAERCARHGRPFSVALIDLDHFKQINDRHGHAVGDEVLRRFALEAQGHVRACDVMARWGGEEFLLLAPEAHAARAQAIVERLRTQVQALRVPFEGGELGVGFSAGVAEARPGETLVELLARADRALYAAKAAGRSRSEVAPAPTAPAA